MAYADIQNKVGQIQMANRILLAQRMDPNKTPETDLSGFQEQGGYAPETGDVNLRDVNTDTPVEGTLTERRRIYPDYKVNRKRRPVKGNNRFKGLTDDQIRAKVAEEAAQRAREAEEERRDQDPELNKQREDMRQGDYLEDPENPFNINTLLQIGGAIGGGIVPLLQQLLIRNPNAMAMNFEDTNLNEGGFVSLDHPNIYINSGAEAHILEPDGNFKFDGFYDPKRHGRVFPGLGLVQRNDGMKIAKTPYTPPTEKMVVGNKLEDSPLRFKTDDQREQYMLDYSKNFRYDGT